MILTFGELRAEITEHDDGKLDVKVYRYLRLVKAYAGIHNLYDVLKEAQQYDRDGESVPRPDPAERRGQGTVKQGVRKQGTGT